MADRNYPQLVLKIAVATMSVHTHMVRPLRIQLLH